MSLVLGAAVSYSPLLYRPREQWQAVSEFLTRGVTQPAARDAEVDAMLANYERRVDDAFAAISKLIDGGALDALVVLYSDRSDMFDESNVPQLHMQVGGEIWGSGQVIHDLAERPIRRQFSCHHDAAEILSEELVRRGFDLSEGRESFKPVGAAGRGIGPAVADAVRRLDARPPLIPLHVNCHVTPTLSGTRLDAFGRALAEVAALGEHRLGVLVTGGLSGDPYGPMAGWIDEVLDRWVLDRVVRDQADEIAEIWDARSRTLLGNSAEIRLWQVAAAALGRAGCRARVVDYLPIHHAATGVGFVTWEQAS